MLKCQNRFGMKNNIEWFQVAPLFCYAMLSVLCLSSNKVKLEILKSEKYACRSAHLLMAKVENFRIINLLLAYFQRNWKFIRYRSMLRHINNELVRSWRVRSGWKYFINKVSSFWEKPGTTFALVSSVSPISVPRRLRINFHSTQTDAHAKAAYGNIPFLINFHTPLAQPFSCWLEESFIPIQPF